MTRGELCYITLGSHLGIPSRHPMTPTQVNVLRKKVQQTLRRDLDTHIDMSLLIDLGYDEPDCLRIMNLLADRELAEDYVATAEEKQIRFYTPCTPDYPQQLLKANGYAPPPVLWAKGDFRAFQGPKISIVGCRKASMENRLVSDYLGVTAARMGFVVVSGGASGIDEAGMEGCHRVGGLVLCVTPDSLLYKVEPPPRTLYLSEDGYDIPFNNHRALSRNHVIHLLGEITFVGQCNLRGGTWSGTTRNLSKGWTPVYHYEKDSEAAWELTKRGAKPVQKADLKQLLLDLKQKPKARPWEEPDHLFRLDV